MDEDVDNRKYLELDEVLEALKSLDIKQRYWLLAQARNMSSGGPYSAEELLSTTFAKVLDEDIKHRRHLPRKFAVTTGLRNAMRSIAGHDREKDAREEGSDVLENTVESRFGNSVSEEQGRLEDAVDFDRIYRHLCEVFSEDSLAIHVLNARYNDGYSENETCELLDISRREYDTTLKKIRRRANRDFAGGN